MLAGPPPVQVAAEMSPNMDAGGLLGEAAVHVLRDSCLAPVLSPLTV